MPSLVLKNKGTKEAHINFKLSIKPIIKKLLMTIYILIIVMWLMFFKVIVGSGKSMLPTIPQKALLLCIKQSNYEVGDVVNYQTDHYNVVHRIISKQDNGNSVKFQMKGDGNTTVDNYLITKENIKCRVLL